MNLMKEISSYLSKVIHLERILSDLDLLSSILPDKNGFSSEQIIEVLQTEQNSNFIQQKQNEFNSILTKQQKRIEQLKSSLNTLFRVSEKH